MKRSTRVQQAADDASALRHWTVRAAPMCGLPALLAQLGVPAAALLRECGLPATAFDEPDAWLPFGDVTHVLGLAAQRSGRADLGLLLAEGTDAQTLGPLAGRMMLAPTVGEALGVLRRDFHLHDRGAVPYLADLGQGRVALGYALHWHDTPGIAVVYDLALGIGLRLLRALCGPGFVLHGVALAHEAPRDARPYRRHFGVPIVFDAAHARLEFAAHWLERPIAGTSQAVREHLRQAAREHDAGAARSHGERVRSVAHALLMTGGLSEPRIAQELGLHVRTLRRRLTAEGLRAQALIGGVRDQFAQQLLAETRLSVAEIAQAAQYAEAASFARAFRRRVGLSPGRWRTLNRPADRG